jgi:hypothetical protein
MYGGITDADDRRFFLGLRTVPGRVEGLEAGWLLGFNREEISILTNAGILKVLGKPAANSPKYYSSSLLKQHAASPEWLEKASRAIHDFWRKKNQKRQTAREDRE